jgi:molecular chaperone DnaK
MEGGDAKVITNPEGGRTTPSIVAMSSDSGERLVGQIAKRQAVTNPENTVFGVKRLIGRKFTSPRCSRTSKICPIENHRSGKRRCAHPPERAPYSPAEISSFILATSKNPPRIPGRTGHRCGDHRAGLFQRQPAPGHQGCRQNRRPQRPAHHQRAHGRLAGLRLDKKKEEKIAVFDLGGGTFDISVMEIGDGVFEVKATNGDTHLGGEDFDLRLIDYWPTSSRKEQGIDLRGDKMACSASKRRRKRPKWNCPPPWKPRSTCRLSLPMPAAPNT